MPSFLNKVFGYKRHDDKDTTRPSHEISDSNLLDGKYEAIGPIVSPTASTFVEAQQIRDSDRDAGFSLFRPRGRGAQKSSKKHPEALPHLTLHLPGSKENSDSRPLSTFFEADSVSQIMLDDAVIAKKRLNPLEALILIRACTQAIAERGLETLGIMHPHWFSASPEIQRKLISLFIHSLTQNPITTLSPTPTSSILAFENELRFTRSPHDVAAVLRWGLRHLSIENGHFGKDSADWGWYNAFFEAERDASYPLKAFSELLSPRLPASHFELLTTTLGLISSLASHAEVNSISGSKLSKFMGLWLLLATRAEESDDWNRFYARWERSGRILEHLFLARLREESAAQRLPTRLQELTQSYPYKGSAARDDGLLSRPRFSTRQHDALFVRVETLLTCGAGQPKQHPVQLLLDVFQLPTDNLSGSEHIAFWNTLKAAATPEDPEGPQFTRIFVDETIHLLSLIPADNNISTLSNPLTSPIAKMVSRKRSTKALNANNGSIPVSPPVSPTSPSSIVITDWTQFTLSGFGDTPPTQPLAALLSQDDDLEVTQPQISRKSSRYRRKSRPRRRRSDEPSDTRPSSQRDAEPTIIETKLASVHVVQIDEAFIDFWSDAIVDPISTNWPSFVVCGLKPIPTSELPIRWLVIEQAYNRQQPSRVPSPDGRRGRSPRPSFKSDISGFRINSVFSSARKRFSIFNRSATDLDPKKSGGKIPVAGELGEVLVEEEVTFPSGPATSTGLHADGNGAATVTSDRTPDVTDQTKTSEISTTLIAGIPSATAFEEGSNSIQAAAAAAPSIEPASQSKGGYNGSSLLSRATVRASEETISVERGSNSKASRVPSLPASRPAPSVEDSFVGTVHVEAENVPQHIAIDSEDRPIQLVTQITDHDEDLHTKSPSEPSDLDAVQVDVANSGSVNDKLIAMLPIPETVGLVVTTPVAQRAVIAALRDEASVRAVDERHVTVRPSQKTSIDLAAAFAVESVGHKIDDLSPVSSTVITETGTQPAAHSKAPVADQEAQGVTEHAEIATPAPEPVVLQATLRTEASSVTHPTEEFSFEVVAAKTEAAADQVARHAAKEAIEVAGVSAGKFASQVEDRAPAEAPITDDEVVVETGDLSTILAEEVQPFSGAEPPSQAAEEALSHRSDPEAVIAVAALAKSTPDLAVEDAKAYNPFLDSIPAEVTGSDPVADEVHIPVDAALITSESVAITSTVPIEEPITQDEQAPVEADQASSVFAPQRVDDAADAHRPETVAEPELVAASASAPSVKDAPSPVETEESTPVAVGVRGEVGASHGDQ